MVKKIRLVDKPEADTKKTSGKTGAVQPEMMELLKSMDWKLWEMLQIAQRWEAANEPATETESVENDDTTKSGSSD
tara:strand:+ start:766 stop:993 length:228 start_codon:yes stop_codon:yes gene_type:complete